MEVIGMANDGMVFSGSEAAQLVTAHARHRTAASRHLVRQVPHAVLNGTG
jgi:hypothetical protein